MGFLSSKRKKPHHCDAAIDYGIEEANRIKNWPALIEAVEQCPSGTAKKRIRPELGEFFFYG
jgi:hypothetical protein